MKVLLAGATGVIGRPLTTALLAAGHEVIALSRSGAVIEGATTIQADALDRDGLLRALAGHSADAVISQLTALKRPKRKVDANDPSTVLRIVGTANLIAAAEALGAQRFLTQSLALAYGYFDHGERPLTEADPFGVKTGQAADFAIDGLVSAETQTAAVNGIALRYGIFYGPGTWMDPAARGRMPVPARGGGVLPWVHVTDAAAATVAALEKGRPGRVYNIVDGPSATWGEMVGARALRVPGWLLRLAVPYLGQLLLDTSMRVSSDRARAELGWAPAHQH